jgi:hypothetical protein
VSLRANPKASATQYEAYAEERGSARDDVKGRAGKLSAQCEADPEAGKCKG